MRQHIRGPYLFALVANLGLETAFAVVAARRLGDPLVTAPNLLTLSRGVSAALLCATAFSGQGAALSWPALLAGCTAADWLDGPLARRRGPTRLGAVLDVEADSWLTLWAAITAYRRRRLGGLALIAPALRYALAGSGPTPLRRWQRAAGVAQMVVLCAALAPWRPARSLASRLSPLAAAGQIAALVGGRGRGRRRWRGSWYRRVRIRESLWINDAHLAHGLPLADH